MENTIREQLDLAWFAGFFDGEGYVGMSRGKGHGKDYLIGTMQIAQKEPMVLFRVLYVVHELGLPRPYIGANKGCVILEWYGYFACKVLRALLPYLSPRNIERVGIFLQAFSVRWSRGRTPMPPEVKVAREQLFERYKHGMEVYRTLDSSWTLPCVKAEAERLWEEE